MTAHTELTKIRERLNHEPCCDHSGRDEHGCWDCRNTGCDHPPYVDGQAAEDFLALVEALEGILGYIDAWDVFRQTSVGQHPADYALGKFSAHDDILVIINRKLEGR